MHGLGPLDREPLVGTGEIILVPGSWNNSFVNRDDQHLTSTNQIRPAKGSRLYN